MYLLDTNVVSELRKASVGKANAQVVEWACSVSVSSMYLSVISVLELEIGILRLERKDAAQASILRTWLNTYVLPTFADRMLVVDMPIVQCCAKWHAPDLCAERDALIAATGLVHGMTVVTRNTNDFQATGVALLNPWTH